MSMDIPDAFLAVSDFIYHPQHISDGLAVV